MLTLCALIAFLWFCPAPSQSVGIAIDPQWVVRTVYVSEVSDPMFNSRKACELLAGWFARELPEHPEWDKRVSCVEVK